MTQYIKRGCSDIILPSFIFLQCEDMNHKWQSYNQRRELDIGKQREELLRYKKELEELKTEPHVVSISYYNYLYSGYHCCTMSSYLLLSFLCVH